MRMPADKYIQIRVTDKRKKQVQALGHKYGLTVTELVNRALENFQKLEEAKNKALEEYVEILDEEGENRLAKAKQNIKDGKYITFEKVEDIMKWLED
jgi:antitoxin component of RelBE/YafQ-DinJ toxin-antitoxin module